MIVIDKIVSVKTLKVNPRYGGASDVYIWDGSSNINMKVEESQHTGVENLSSMNGKKLRITVEIIEE